MAEAAAKMSRRPSLQDVARLAGVSPAAVSYVVNGRTKEVGAETRKEIESAIKALHYRPHRRGLSLKFNREFAIGLVVVDPNPDFLSDPFTTQVATGLSNALAEPGYGLTVTGCKSLAALKSLLARPIGVDAFVVIASGPPSLRRMVYRMLSDVGLPIVTIQDKLPQAIKDGCAIMQDDFSGATQLTNHLLQRGADRFLFVAPDSVWPAIERRKAGLRSLLPDGCFAPVLRCAEHDFEGTTSAIQLALEKDPEITAILGANDQIAMAALRALSRGGFDVPGKVQVTGFNSFAFRAYVTPLLTTVASNAVGIGRQCARSILARLDGVAFPSRCLTLPVSLEEGGTTRKSA